MTAWYSDRNFPEIKSGNDCIIAVVEDLNQREALITDHNEREATLAERDARIKAFEAAVMKISEITKRNGRLSEMEKITRDFDAAMTEAEKLVGSGR